MTYGQIDEIGLNSESKAVDTYELHATGLHPLGLVHLKVTLQTTTARSVPRSSTVKS
jgi:hypothetical protein